MNRLYPVFVKLSGKPCLVVGGGEIAARKVRQLLECHAQVTVISPDTSLDMQKIIDKNKIFYRAKVFQHKDTEGFFLVIAATNERLVNKLVSEECEEKGILCNIVDEPDQCNFFVPAVVRQGDLKIAISTNGKSPTLAKRIRKELEQNYTKEYTLFIRYLGFLRLFLKRQYPDAIDQKKQLLEKVIESNALEMLKCKDKKGFKEEINRVFESFSFKLLTAEAQSQGVQ